MYDSPGSLQDICVEAICDQLDMVFERCLFVGVQCENPATPELLCSQPTDHRNAPLLPPYIYVTKYKFREKEQFLHEDVAHLLLEKLVARAMLSDETLSLFSADNCRLVRVLLKDCHKVTTQGLRELAGHRLEELECSGIPVPVTDIIGCLGQRTLDHLKYLNVSHCTFVESYKYCSIIAITQFNNLRVLNVANTAFNKHALEVACEDLKSLQSINISNTKVHDIEPLMRCKDRLTNFSMFNLMANLDLPTVIVILRQEMLTYLDVSCERPGLSPFDITQLTCQLSYLLNCHRALPNLEYFDISGKHHVSMENLMEFVIQHNKLTFLGLMFSENCHDEMFTNPGHPAYRAGLMISGMSNEAQVLTSLRVYTDRANYIQKSLYYLFRLSPSFNEPRSDIIRLVLPGMSRHPDQFGVQMAATACLYNLTKGDLSTKVHPNLLKQVVNLSIDAMEMFPSQYQIQKNALLTLCSDRILQDVNFAKFRCAKLVILALCSTEDPSMNRMAVAIISILAAKITTEETSVIGSVPMYMKKLLKMIDDKVSERNCDITMKFTLSALWNLTDESAVTCTVFLREGGIDLFLKVLIAFAGESSIETKVLGLINNIAEVPDLRRQLMLPELLTKLRDLLRSGHLDVSYFAAGIIAHLANDGEQTWIIPEISRSDMLTELGNVVAEWKTPDVEMVAYRTFRPFFPLIKNADDYEIQLWAVWAIHHVCTKNPLRYCQMLLDEECDQLLETILQTNQLQPKIGQLITAVLEIIQCDKLNSLN